MKRFLTLTAIIEAATGLALLVVPSLVGRLLFGAELTGVAIPVARVLGIALIALGCRLLAWQHCALRHVDLRRSRDAVSLVSRHPRRMGRGLFCGQQLCYMHS